ncbi:MAG: DUF4406 domain-containing protein [Dysgonamonadaceae bacterium]|jgi:hypothetical protein|nr:DUF4406 domain-containing protein [Dysgonamonadaceae bacterium]
MKRCYISGKISGLRMKEVRSKFKAAEKAVKALDYEPVSPLNNGLPANAPWERRIAANILMLSGCDAIYLLPDWDESVGATIEKQIATYRGKKIIFADDPQFEDIMQAIYEACGITFAQLITKDRRIFPRRTNATPDDDMVAINRTPDLFSAICPPDEVHIDCTFTWDIPVATFLFEQWQKAGFNTKIGGVAFGERGENFVAGMYLKRGYVITSRGCPNNCWFCTVPKREGRQIRELPIVDGYNILDDNLLATSDSHFNAVIDMLKRQKERPIFSGGLEAKILTENRAKMILDLNPKEMFFAYDTPDDYEPLVEAGKLLQRLGYRKASQIARCYVLIGGKRDTFEQAEKRVLQAWDAGFFPMAMLFRDKQGDYDKDWRRFQRQWANPTIVAENLKRRKSIMI